MLTLISTLSIAAMVGDVNIYMNDSDDMQIAEIEIMIAEHKRYLPYNTKLLIMSYQKKILIMSLFLSSLTSSLHLHCLHTFLLGFNNPMWTSYLDICYLNIFVERSNKLLQLIY